MVEACGLVPSGRLLTLNKVLLRALSDYAHAVIVFVNRRSRILWFVRWRLSVTIPREENHERLRNYSRSFAIDSIAAKVVACGDGSHDTRIHVAVSAAGNEFEAFDHCGGQRRGFRSSCGLRRAM